MKSQHEGESDMQESIPHYRQTCWCDGLRFVRIGYGVVHDHYGIEDAGRVLDGVCDEVNHSSSGQHVHMSLTRTALSMSFGLDCWQTCWCNGLRFGRIGNAVKHGGVRNAGRVLDGACDEASHSKQVVSTRPHERGLGLSCR